MVMRYEESMVADLQQAIQQLPSKRRNDLTARQIVEAVKEDLRLKMAEGWTVGELSRFLAEKGFKISPVTLRDYLKHPRKSRTRSKRSGRSVSRPDSEQAKGAMSDAVVSGTPVADSVTPSPVPSASVAVGNQRSFAGFDESN